MPRRKLAGLIVALLAGGGFLACSQDEPVAPGASPTMPAGHQMSGDVTTLAAFPFRATFDPFSVHQPPDLMVLANTPWDIVIENPTWAPGARSWHFHPGPSFVAVISGRIKLERAPKGGCTETPEFTAGGTYLEIGNEVHRAVVIEQTELIVTRFIPPGLPVMTVVPAPQC